MIGKEDFHKFPLCIDLDGTLWPGDCAWLSIKLFLKKYPYGIPLLLKWWLSGRAVLKREVARNVAFDPSLINFYEPVLEYALALKAKGARLFLVTGSDMEIADSVARHLGIFERTFGSHGGKNMVGENKAKLLNETFGKRGYVYFGNEYKDCLVWRDSAAAVAVNASNRTKKRLSAIPIYAEYLTC